MNIPVILLNFNRLATTEKLVDQLLLLGYNNLYILDLGSTYSPLLDYYNICKSFTVIPYSNRGHKALWEDGLLREQFKQYPWIVVSDSDIELGSGTPRGFIEDMICTAKDFRVDKCGLAIEYLDITNLYLKNIIEPIESRYWQQKLPHITNQVYVAPTDTTFCVVRPELPFTYRGVRLAGEYTCKHMDWYQDWNKLTEEQQYYIDHADEKIATTKQHYLNYLNNR